MADLEPLPISRRLDRNEIQVTAAIDLERVLKRLYRAGPAPELVEVPELGFLMIDGQGDPNLSERYRRRSRPCTASPTRSSSRSSAPAGPITGSGRPARGAVVGRGHVSLPDRGEVGLGVDGDDPAAPEVLLEHITGRVVTVSSTAHRFGSIDFEDLNWARKPYNPWRAYGQSKLANLLFTAMLQRRLTAAGSDVLATAAHPGYAATNLQSQSQRRFQDLLMAIGNRLLAQDAEAGALPTLYAAVADVPGNSFAGPGRFLEQRGVPKL